VVSDISDCGGSGRGDDLLPLLQPLEVGCLCLRPLPVPAAPPASHQQALQASQICSRPGSAVEFLLQGRAEQLLLFPGCPIEQFFLFGYSAHYFVYFKDEFFLLDLSPEFRVPLVLILKALYFIGPAQHQGMLRIHALPCDKSRDQGARMGHVVPALGRLAPSGLWLGLSIDQAAVLLPLGAGVQQLAHLLHDSAQMLSDLLSLQVQLLQLLLVLPLDANYLLFLQLDLPLQLLDGFLVLLLLLGRQPIFVPGLPLQAV
jgi:hypothetical protein